MHVIPTLVLLGHTSKSNVRTVWCGTSCTNYMLLLGRLPFNKYRSSPATNQNKHWHLPTLDWVIMVSSKVAFAWNSCFRLNRKRNRILSTASAQYFYFCCSAHLTLKANKCFWNTFVQKHFFNRIQNTYSCCDSSYLDCNCKCKQEWNSVIIII